MRNYGLTPKPTAGEWFNYAEPKVSCAADKGVCELRVKPPLVNNPPAPALARNKRRGK